MSQEFEQFLRDNGVKHIKTSPYHPASNWLAERAIQTLKQALKKSDQKRGSLVSHVTEFLFHLKIMPSFTCKTSHGKEVALTPVIPASWGGREGHGIPWSQ